MIQERRKSQRSSVFLIVNFRNLKSLQQHASGITANFSHEGISLESQSMYYAPGEILEIILKDPHGELSVSGEGEVVWRRDRWYKCEMGIKFRQETMGTIREIFELLPNVNKMPAAPPLPDENNRISEARNRDDKDDPVDPAKSDGSTAKAAKIDEAIYLGVIERKITDKEDSMINAITLKNSKVTKKPSGEETKTLLKKESGSDSEGIVLKETFMSTPQKKNRTLIVLLTVLSAVSLAAAALKFDDIKKALPPIIQTDQFIFSQDPAERKDVSFVDGDRANGSNISEPVKSLKIPKDHDIAHASLSGEAKRDVRHTLSVNEGILQDNDLRLTIIFDYNSDAVDPMFHVKIENIANALLASPESIIKIEGYSDDTGPEMYNLNLSMRRSLAVKKMLIRKGIDSARIKVAFWGESNPVASNHTASGRMKNRRVEMFVVSAAD